MAICSLAQRAWDMLCRVYGLSNASMAGSAVGSLRRDVQYLASKIVGPGLGAPGFASVLQCWGQPRPCRTDSHSGLGFAAGIFALCAAANAVAQPGWIEQLQHQATGALYSAHDGANTSLLIQGYYVDPFLQDEALAVPAAVLVAQSSLDVVAAVNIAREYNLTIAARGGGHWGVNARNAADGITVDLSNMRNVTIDPVQQTAVAQGGALGGDILHAAGAWGLGLPWGDINSTGMGLALGGGIGLSMRQHGLTCDRILGAQIVVANGSLITISKTQNHELLRGLKGAGTVFGIVTEVTFQLFNDTTDVYAGYLILPDDSNLTTIRNLTDFTIAALAQYPGLGLEIFSIPGNLAILVVNFFGSESVQQKAAVFDPIRAMGPVKDMLGPNMSSFQLVDDQLAGVFAQSMPAKTYHLSGLMTQAHLMNGGQDALLKALAVARQLTSAVLLTDWFGEGTHNTTSFPPFKGAYMHYYIVLIHPDSQTLQTTTTDLEHILEHYTTHFYAYDNLSSDPEPDKRLASKVGGHSDLHHLRGLKGLLDPDNMFKNYQLLGLTPVLRKELSGQLLAQKLQQANVSPPTL